MSAAHGIVVVRFILALTISLMTSLSIESAEAPHFTYRGPEREHATPVIGVPGYEGHYCGGNWIVAEGDDRFWTYRVYYPKPKLGDLIPDHVRVYRVAGFPPKSAVVKAGAMELEAVNEGQLPPNILRKDFTLAVSPGAILNVGGDAAEFADLRTSLTDHVRVVKIAAARDARPATAGVEVWSDLGDKARRAETVKIGDQLQAGRWKFGVTNVVPPDRERRIVGWAEFELLSVDDQTPPDKDQAR